MRKKAIHAKQQQKKDVIFSFLPPPLSSYLWSITLWSWSTYLWILLALNLSSLNICHLPWTDKMFKAEVSDSWFMWRGLNLGVQFVNTLDTLYPCVRHTTSHVYCNGCTHDTVCLTCRYSMPQHVWHLQNQKAIHIN